MRPDDQLAAESAPSAIDPAISRRALLLAGAALVVAGCGTRSSNPVGDVPMRPDDVPVRGQTGRATTAQNQTAAPIAPAQNTVQGNGYTLVKRSAWTDLPIKGNNNPMGTVTRITVHHTGEHGNWADLPDVEIIQRIEKYHRTEKEWAAIGYHFLVGKDGRIYEGRPAKYQGAHVSTQNENNLGISVIGDFMENLPSDRQLSALKIFLDDKRREYGVGKGRVYGHRDLHASLCPGNALYAWVKRYKTSLA